MMRLSWTFWDIFEYFEYFGRILFDELEAFRLFSSSFPTIFSCNRLMKKRVTDGLMDGPTGGWADGQTDPLIEMRGCI